MHAPTHMRMKSSSFMWVPSSGSCDASSATAHGFPECMKASKHQNACTDSHADEVIQLHVGVIVWVMAVHHGLHDRWVEGEACRPQRAT
eukprot:1148674-Pelagomonas_calceolata.AAC.1